MEDESILQTMAELGAEGATGNDAIAAWLKAELDSPTEAERLRAVLERLGIDERVVSSPEVGDTGEDRTRWLVFDRYRGRETLFETLDLRELAWASACFSEDDLRRRTRTCQHHFEEAYGTRDPGEIAELLNARGEPNGVLDRVREGDVLEPPLLVGTPGCDDFVILEGHNRIISYLRGPSIVVFPLPVLVGFSGTVSRWREW